MADSLLTPAVSTNYSYEFAPKASQTIKVLRSGTAVFIMPAGPITCAGPRQKIAYLAADYWRQQGVLDDIRVVLVLPTPGMFGGARVRRRPGAGRRPLRHRGPQEQRARRGRPASRRAVLADNAAGTQDEITYDLLHVVPPQTAPDWIKRSPLADPANPGGYVEIDKHTRWPNVFPPGDAGSSPNSKTGAANHSRPPWSSRTSPASWPAAPPTCSTTGTPPAG